MSKLLSVASLQAGDRFEFVSLQSNDRFADSPNRDHPNMMIVASEPKVNRAAGSCFFRYRSEANPVDTRSWNGTTEIEVRVFTDREIPETAAPPASAPRAAETTLSAFSSPAAAVLAELPEPPKEKAPRKSTRKPAKADGEKKTKVAEEKIAEKKPAPKKLPAKSSIKIKSIAAAPPPTPARDASAVRDVRKAVKPALKIKKKA